MVRSEERSLEEGKKGADGGDLYSHGSRNISHINYYHIIFTPKVISE